MNYLQLRGYLPLSTWVVKMGITHIYSIGKYVFYSLSLISWAWRTPCSVTHTITLSLQVSSHCRCARQHIILVHTVIALTTLQIYVVTIPMKFEFCPIDTTLSHIQYTNLCTLRPHDEPMSSVDSSCTISWLRMARRLGFGICFG